MKYTVLIRQPVQSERKPELEQQLRERFGLNGEQAQRLSDRRTGRLMKPTGRARAELLLAMFQSVGADVTLEEVREETSVISEPFQTLSAPVRPAAPARPDDAPLAPDRAEAPLSVSGIWPDVDLTPPGGALPDPFAAPGLSAGAFRSERAAGSALPNEFMPAVAWNAPAPGLTPSAPGVGSTNPFAGDAATALMPPPTPAGLPEPDPDPFATAFGAPLVPSAPARAADPAADVWSDFTGALTLTDAAPAPSAPEVAAVPSAAGMDPIVPGLPDSDAPKLRRSSLRNRMTIGALVPLGVSSLLTLGVLAVTLPGLQQNLVQRNAQAVAVAVASNIDPTRGAQNITPQLEALVKNSSVGFVQVELRDGSRYFSSQVPKVSDLLNAQVSNWLIENPNSAVFRDRISPATLYRDQANEMRAMGGTANDVEKLEKQAADPANQSVTNVNYIVQQITVKQENGQRAVSSERASEADAENVLYTVAVGVENGQPQAALRRTLFLVMFVSLLALAIAAYLALRAARAVVQPIEDLVRVADAISMGDLSRPVRAERNDEIGDLAQALERMRLSLDSAMDRLRRRRRS
ncbi:HAMP domain-containing protein [Deinococcus soli (ex Cha et al. 2016)]|uniref:HAMP domain-containing protein n=2 Tax=Deinococcus soli (ex Cha et al. 2016) TaxID=1309411 RepID=A0AAE4BLF4_9DEIO|nr:HAMP domain-containing protein [Deinococcus soli (ex Cha et al. 2016)]MDR6216681.1 HAMP domain-containing protein [Deinococcus soli (ex Cha et al. 2016)]MDR6327502.1 HAMP domain-containing protein [Deinococcus soli (ex Cha et al. 2016)]MDR6749777.1 HAMP domain-containing protein [Deinococcus soli (ex Cha et al. 2016)]